MVDTEGKMQYFLIEDDAFILEHRGSNSITKVFPNKNGTRIVVIDNTGNGYLFNPVDESTLLIPNFQSGTYNVLWDL